MNEREVILCGNANRELAATVARLAGVRLGEASVERFPDGEVSVELGESVRDRRVFLIQSTAPPVNDHLMELLTMIDACRRAAAARIVAVVPYFGYARSDKRHGRRDPIAARLVADLLQAAGADHVVSVDLHASQIEGFFRVPMECLTAVPLLCETLRPHLPAGTIVASPDAGRLAMATHYARCLDTSVVLLHKTRQTGSETHVTHLVGDVRDRPCLIIDDMISTGGTMVAAVEALLRNGARPGIMLAATHGLFVGPAREVLSAEGIGNVFVTDSIEQRLAAWPRLQVVSLAPLLADALQRASGPGRSSVRG